MAISMGGMGEDTSAAVTIGCDGVPLAGTVPLLSVDATLLLDGTAQATLRFAADPDQNDPASVMAAASLGRRLSVALGYDTSLQQVFIGEVQTHRLRMPPDGKPEFVLTATSRSAPAMLDDTVAIAVRYGDTLLAFDIERACSNSEGAALPGGLPREYSRGNVLVPGTAMARLGALLSLDGLGTAFDGNVRIVATHHSMVSGNWTTRIDFRSTDLDAGDHA